MECNYCPQTQGLRWEMIVPRQWEIVCEDCCPLPDAGSGIPLWDMDDAIYWLQARLPESMPIIKRLYSLLLDSERLEAKKLSYPGFFPTELTAKVHGAQMSFLFMETSAWFNFPPLPGKPLPPGLHLKTGEIHTVKDITQQYYSKRLA